MKKCIFVIIALSFLMISNSGWGFDGESASDMKIATGPGGEVYVNINQNHYQNPLNRS